MHLFKKEVNKLASDGTEILPNRGESRRGELGEFNTIKSNDGYVIRHAPTCIMKGTHEAEGNLVIGAKYCRHCRVLGYCFPRPVAAFGAPIPQVGIWRGVACFFKAAPPCDPSQEC